ncbi:MAG: MBL fold metallo-hydrolase [Flavobacteriales bacterium]|nr:MBL fold metallo-hydrolase [Flavobacteriales bacterium]NNK79932.1 MBL fold metallo-hydrolase [Flavobacteriales bacterium]
MKVEQIYTGCLAHGAYYIESNGEAAIIDPLREVQPYIDMAESRGAKIKWILETHFHADFVSGHVDLSKKTGAPIVFGPTTMETGYDMIVAEDGQEFPLGNVKLKLIHTPGHTTESSCYLLIDENGKETSLFSGDTLFIGDVGRPDLAQKVIAELTQDKLASMLYDSLRTKIMPLDDDIIVYPGHGAGSACGKNMSKETTDTLGNQKKTNYALNPELNREEFINEILTGLTPPPGYFPHNVLMNIGGYESIDEVVEHGTKALSPDEFETVAEETNAFILDTREAQTFAKGFIPGSYNIGLEGSFANWVGVVFQDVKQPLIIVADEGREEEVAIRLARIGFDNNQGFLKGGIKAWTDAGKSLDKIESINIEDLSKVESANILDVRKESEFKSEHVLEAENAPLDYWRDSLAQIDKEKKYYVHCKSGYRSMIFTSILRALGYDKLIDINGGFEAIKESEKFDISEYICPTTML